ncbi:MAG TPA: hypothetical protein VKH83_06470 [Methylomirabilota bacterium]|nr:hypothetical protein [Methylomirabilota bacterium]
MDKDMFKDRERSFEEEYFRKHDAKLLQKLRERARLEEIAEELAVKLQVDNPKLLERIMALGVTLDTASAFLLAPLVQVAWAGGSVTDRERQAVLRVATGRGVEKESPAYAQLGKWLRERPADTVFDAAIETIKTGLSVLTPDEQAERTRRIVDACRQVAEASGGLGRVLGLGSSVSGEEETLLDAISTSLRAR